MSGKLKILPKKRWNVWNQDNVEKVLRDERLHKEEVEAAKEKSRNVQSEHIMELLLQNGCDTTMTSTELVIIPPQPNKSLQNEEYRKEKEERELLKKRQEGVADWALGEGAAETQKVKPWYLQKPTSKVSEVRGKRIQNEEVDEFLHRDSERKSRLDPMAQYLTYQPSVEKDATSQTHMTSAITAPTNTSTTRSESLGFGHLMNIMGVGDNRFNAESDISHRDAKRHKEKKKENKKKHKKHHKKHSRGSGSSSGSSDSEDKSRSEVKHKQKRKSKSKSSHENNNEINIDELRRKREERERLERKRTSVLLSTHAEHHIVDVDYGNGKKRQKYNQQYNPSLGGR
jgi:hypothetical protein